MSNAELLSGASTLTAGGLLQRSAFSMMKVDLYHSSNEETATDVARGWGTNCGGDDM